MPTIRILGPIEVWRNQQPIRIPRKQQRLLLGILALEVGNFVPVSHLIDAIWGARPPASVRAMVQTRISELRAIIAAETPTESFEVESNGSAAYRLVMQATDIDAHSFVDKARSWRQVLDPAAGRDQLRDALALWRGPLFEGAALEHFAGAIDMLQSARMTALEDLFGLDIYTGDHSAVVDLLAESTAEHPTRERLRGQAMIALALCGRSSEAIALYRPWLRWLRDELGTTPTAQIEEVYTSILHNANPLSMRSLPIIAGALPPGAKALRAASALSGDFRAATPRTVPAPIADLAGRKQELDELLAALRADDTKLIAISGPGGIGKTTLSIAAAHLARSHFSDGQLYADLRAEDRRKTPGPFEVLGRFLRALGVDSGMPDDVDGRVDLYRTLLAESKLLVVLDNVESDEQVGPLLPTGRHCRTIINSRNRIGKTLGARSMELTLMPRADALSLLELVIGAKRVRAEPQPVAALIEQCGHLPLAIRIAGAILAAKSHWTIARLAEMLRDEHQRLSRLKYGHLDVRATIAVSYDGLKPEAQRLLQRVGMLKLTDFGTWAAAALLDIEIESAELLLDELADAQLLTVIGVDGNSRPRYTMHDLVRLFAEEQASVAVSAREFVAARSRAYSSYLFVLEAAFRRVQGGDYQAIRGSSPRRSIDLDFAAALVEDPLGWFESEHRSVVAMVHAAAADGHLEICWELAFAASRLFQMSRYFDQWQTLLESVRVYLGEADPSLTRGRGAIHLMLGWVNIDRTNYPVATANLEIARSLFVRVGDAHGVATAEVYLGNVARYGGDIPTAQARYDAAYGALSRGDDVGGLAFVHREIAQTHLQLKEHDAAAKHLQTALDIYTKINADQGRAQVLFWYSRLLIATGQADQALRHLTEALELVKAISDRTGQAHIHRGLALAYRAVSDHRAARKHLVEALKIAKQPYPTQLETLLITDIEELDQVARSPS